MRSTCSRNHGQPSYLRRGERSTEVRQNKSIRNERSEMRALSGVKMSRESRAAGRRTSRAARRARRRRRARPPPRSRPRRRSRARPAVARAAAERLRDAEPRGQVAARLRPRELPRDRAQALDAALRVALRRPRADLEPPELLLGRRLLEVRHEARLAAHDVAVRVARRGRHGLHALAPRARHLVVVGLRAVEPGAFAELLAQYRRACRCRACAPRSRASRSSA